MTICLSESSQKSVYKPQVPQVKNEQGCAGRVHQQIANPVFCSMSTVAIVYIIAHVVNWFYVSTGKQIHCVNVELHENVFIVIVNFFRYYACTIV